MERSLENLRDEIDNKNMLLEEYEKNLSDSKITHRSTHHHSTLQISP
jgi:hypothetical protein